jgi:purine-binding chemotaxis protein CheW
VSATNCITFLVDGQLFGVPTTEVMELARLPRLTRVPLAPPAVAGLLNLRGQVVTAVDLRTRLGLRARPAGQPAMNVVLQRVDVLVSLLVDQVGDVIELTEATFEPPPDTLRGLARELVRGVHKLPGQLLLLLDVDKVLAGLAISPRRAALPLPTAAANPS